MSVFRSIFRFITTLGGLISSRIDDETDSMVTTSRGVKAAYRQTREQWTAQYHDIRNAVSGLMMSMEDKRNEIKKLSKDLEDLETKKRGSVEKFKATKEEKYQVAFADYHARTDAVRQRLDQLKGEVAELEGQIGGYKIRLLEMQTQIQNLDQQESEAIADIVSSRQIVELNDRMAKIGTSMSDENLRAIEKSRSLLKSKAKLSGELAGTDKAVIDREVHAAGVSGDAMDEFTAMLAESELKSKERGEATGPEIDRTM